MPRVLPGQPLVKRTLCRVSVSSMSKSMNVEHVPVVSKVLCIVLMYSCLFAKIYIIVVISGTLQHFLGRIT